MKGDPEFVILKYQSWLDTEKFEKEVVGAIVKQYLSPVQDYCPVEEAQWNKLKFTEGCLTDFDFTVSKEGGVSATASLESLAGFNVKADMEDKVHLEGKFIRFKRLLQHDQFFDDRKTDPAVRKTVPRWIKWPYLNPVWVVVGIMTCEDVTINFENKRELQVDGHIEVPIGEITVAGMPLGNAGNPKVGAGAHKKTATVFKAQSGRNQIFALELRKVTTSKFKSKILKMGDSGPVVKDGRLAANDSDDSDGEAVQDLKKPVTADELILE
ncbi:hypothetical protein BKA61DRAFT_482019 [Leptodontidium sp. MPI-SDFR-AT-0119]|nr:hypothetical protein BKA61DRAFT_482019 [Leptodontidium sp. MPI-SDFR-AT-0119]